MNRQAATGFFLVWAQPSSGVQRSLYVTGGRRTAAGCAPACPGDTKAKKHRSSLRGGEAALQLKGGERSAWGNYVFIIIPKPLCHKSHFPSGHVAAELLMASVPSNPPADCSGRWLLTCHTCPQFADPGGAGAVCLRKCSPPEHDYRVLLTIELLWGFFFFFSRKTDPGTLEGSRVRLHYNSADRADAGRSFDSQAQTPSTQAPRASKEGHLKGQAGERPSAAMLMPPSCGRRRYCTRNGFCRICLFFPLALFLALFLSSSSPFLIPSVPSSFLTP